MNSTLKVGIPFLGYFLQLIALFSPFFKADISILSFFFADASAVTVIQPFFFAEGSKQTLEASRSGDLYSGWGSRPS